MLNIYAFPSYLKNENRRMLFPLLRELLFKKDSPLLSYFKIVDFIEKAEVIIIPVDVNFFFESKNKDELWILINEAKAWALPIWVYSSGDIGKTLKANVYTFRLGGFNSKLDEKTFILPAFIQDPYKAFLNKEFQPLKKEDMPSIGFAGHANGSILKWIKEFSIFLLSNFKRIRTNKSFDYQSFFPSGKVRYDILMRLMQHPKIKADFIFRKRYRAGAKTQEEKKRTTLEFYDNIERTPYTLCIRGAGNFSIRLYEVLAMGRIPILVNTDFRLPLPWLNWNNHCLISDKKYVWKSILDFHNSNSQEEFIKIQISNKEFWEENLTIEGYFKQIHDYFKKI